MIYETTHKNDEATKSINDLLGKPYTFIEAIKMKGVGSKRMMVKEVSPKFKNILNSVSDVNYSNIELRKKGVVVHITKGHKTFSWAIPYYQLTIYQTNGFSLYAHGNFVKFERNKLLKENKKFLDKLVDLKCENSKKYEFR